MNYKDTMYKKKKPGISKQFSFGKKKKNYSISGDFNASVLVVIVSSGIKSLLPDVAQHDKWRCIFKSEHGRQEN